MPSFPCKDSVSQSEDQKPMSTYGILFLHMFPDNGSLKGPLYLAAALFFVTSRPSRQFLPWWYRTGIEIDPRGI